MEVTYENRILYVVVPESNYKEIITQLGILNYIVSERKQCK